MSSSIAPVSQAISAHSGINRRGAQRSATHLHGILRFLDRMHVIQGSVCDVSVGGAGFICQQTVAPQSRCTLQFVLPSQNQAAGPTVVVPATVVSTMQVLGQAYQFRVNLRFGGLPPAAHRHIEEFILRSLSRG